MTAPDDKGRANEREGEFPPTAETASSLLALPLAALARGWVETPANSVARALEEARSRYPGGDFTTEAQRHREGQESSQGATIRADGGAKKSGEGFASEAESSGFIDLINATPHENGLVFPPDILEGAVSRALGTEAVRVYRPDSRGQRAAREAVAAFYHRRGVEADPERILLTPGTSLAYFYALRLLTEPGDEILIPSPGYPLFDDIAALCGVRTRAYHLTTRARSRSQRGQNHECTPIHTNKNRRNEATMREEDSTKHTKEESGDEEWRVDLEEIAWQCTPRTRVIMVVSPHNPTGCVFTPEELDGLARICRERNLAVVFDEVFSEFLATSAATATGNSSTKSTRDTKTTGGEGGGFEISDLRFQMEFRQTGGDSTTEDTESGEPGSGGRRGRLRYDRRGGLLPRPEPAGFPLVVTLNGFSKMFSLPGWKVGWMKVDGAAGNVGQFFKALEYLSDTFLPVPDLIQAMIPEILAKADPGVSAALSREYETRRNLALSLLEGKVYRPEGGVYLVGRLPAAAGDTNAKAGAPSEPDTGARFGTDADTGATASPSTKRRDPIDSVDSVHPVHSVHSARQVEDDEAFCLRALKDHGVFVHPGYYYDLPPGHFVLTCVAAPDRLREGIARLNRALGDR